ncbi:MAG: AraC family transcriptional regulator, partial [Nannocystaceae bacterium]|nr:AraC family transcriptional regulator [Nannocystaceae bacterium]
LVGPHPMRVPITRVNAVWLAAVEESGDPAIGVRTAMALETGDYGVLKYAARASATLREGFERVGHYQKLLNDRAAVEFHDQGDVTTMAYLPTQVPAAYVEFVLASWVTFGRVLPAGPLPITAVHLTHAPPSDTSIHRAVYGSVIEWEAETAQLRLDRVAFTRPLATDPALVAVLDRHAAASLPVAPAGGIRSNAAPCSRRSRARRARVAHGDSQPAGRRRRLAPEPQLSRYACTCSRDFSTSATRVSTARAASQPVTLIKYRHRTQSHMSSRKRCPPRDQRCAAATHALSSTLQRSPPPCTSSCQKFRLPCGGFSQPADVSFFVLS